MHDTDCTRNVLAILLTNRIAASSAFPFFVSSSRDCPQVRRERAAKHPLSSLDLSDYETKL